MLSLRCISLILAVAFVLACAQAAPAKPLQENSGLDNVFDGPKVINIVDDFLVFWDQAKDQPLYRQRRLWMQLVQSKHPDYFERAVYRGAGLTERRALLNDFLLRVPAQVEAIREFNANVSNVGTSALAEAYVLFTLRFPEYRQAHDIYLGLSMYTFDGAIRAVNNDEGAPDTLCLGAEVLSSYSSDQLRIALAHELFHLYHFSFLFRNPSLADFQTASMPLMIEGMAVAGAEAVYERQPLAAYLHFSEDELSSQQEAIAGNAKRFLELVQTGATSQSYGAWFTGSDAGAAPPRGAYLLGYEVVNRVLAGNRLEQMVRMTPAELREHADEQLAAMAADGIFLVSLAR